MCKICWFVLILVCVCCESCICAANFDFGIKVFSVLYVFILSSMKISNSFLNEKLLTIVTFKLEDPSERVCSIVWDFVLCAVESFVVLNTILYFNFQGREAIFSFLFF